MLKKNELDVLKYLKDIDDGTIENIFERYDDHSENMSHNFTCDCTDFLVDILKLYKNMKTGR